MTVFKMLDKLAKYIAKGLFCLASALAVGMIVINGLAIVFRYVLHSSFSWGEEVLKIMLVWFGLFSVGIIAQKRDHIGIVIFKQKMPPKVQQGFEMVCQIFMLTISVVMFVAGLIYVSRSHGSFTPALRIRHDIVYSALPLAFGCMSIIETRNLYYEILRAFGKVQVPDVPGEN